MSAVCYPVPSCHRCNQEREEAIRRNKESIWREKTAEGKDNHGAGATISG
ncbi:hypothetical protein [Aeromonas popoffii]